MKRKLFISAVVVLLAVTPVWAQDVTDPASFFGFKLGSDFKLADWPQIVDYFHLIDSQSDRIQVKELGKSTRGNPFLLAVISSEQNLANLEEYRSLSRKLASGRGFTEEALNEAVGKGKAVVLITCSIHATEVGGTQSSPLLAYRLITDDSPRTRRIRENVILLLVPSFNPDGLRMVKEWYDKYLNTPFEASRMPWLYHYYVGHDNNRDAFMLTQKESKLVNRVLYHDWFPQLYQDMHQMGNRAARIFVPPFYDPLNPNIDPLLVREISLTGLYMAEELQARDLKGVITGAMFTHWWQGGFLRTGWFHNVIGILSEVASANLASPIFQRKSDLRAGFKGLQAYRPAVNYPDPWEGGWWRLSDILRYDLEAGQALLDFAARHKEDILRNMYRMASRAVKRGKETPPFAYVVPPQQWDPLEAYHMLEILQEGGVQVHYAKSGFVADNIPYPPGTHVVLMSQPYRAYAKDLLEPQRYPDMRQYQGGPPLPPYDAAGWTLPFQMGVRVVEVTNPFKAELVRLDKAEAPRPHMPKPGFGYLIDTRLTDSFRAVNLALGAGVPVYRIRAKVRAGGKEFPPGCFVLRRGDRGSRAAARRIVAELRVPLVALKEKPAGLYRLKKVRLGLYQPWLASMHEGWSRWVLEHYGFPYTLLHNAEVKAGSLRDRYDVIYIPDIRAEGILRGRPEGTVPPQYAGGIGPEGLENLRAFVEQGGVLVVMDAASDLVLKPMGLPLVNLTEKLKPAEFFCPGSILAADFDPGHPLAYGMPPRGMVYFSRSTVYKVIPSFKTKVEVAAKYPHKNLLKSGYLLGEKKIASGVAAATVGIGKGKVVLIGFDAINRAQAHSTFKVLFNAIYFPAQ